jgi:hypothetical protein
VCFGGMLECPPAVCTSMLTSMYPFSAIPGTAKTPPNCSEKPPVDVASIGRSRDGEGRSCTSFVEKCREAILAELFQQVFRYVFGALNICQQTKSAEQALLERTWKPVISSSNPKASTTPLRGVKFLLSMVSTVILQKPRSYQQRSACDGAYIHYSDQSTFVVRGSSAPDGFPYDAHISVNDHFNTARENGAHRQSDHCTAAMSTLKPSAARRVRRLDVQQAKEV